MSDDRSHGWRRHLVLPVLLVAAGLLLWSALPRISPTVDEPAHLVSGLAIWTEGDTRLSWGHPPLANALTALPALLVAGDPGLGKRPEWAQARVWELSIAQATADYPRFRRQLHLGRLGVVFLTLLLGTYVYYWCLGQFGQPAAVASATLVLFCPTVLAHGALVTNDLAITLLVVVTLGEFVHYLQRPGWPRLLVAGLVAGLAFATKWSAIAVVPVVILLAVVQALRGAGRFAGYPRGARLVGRLAAESAVAGLLVLFVVNASYGFQRTGWSVERILAHPETQQFNTRGYEGRMLERASPLPHLPAWLPVPVPYGYLYGAVHIRVHNAKGHETWFRGEAHRIGSVDYFPTLLALKTPEAILVLLFVGAAGALASRRRPSLPTATLLLFAGTFLALAMTSHINIGVRHVLPVVAVMSVLAGLTAAALWEGRIGGSLSRRLRRVLVVVCLAATLGAAMLGWPHWLGYFNTIAGGRAGGHAVSIVGEDWGQDVVDLADVVRRHGLVPLAYAPYYPTQAAELAHHGISFLSIPCGVPRERLAGYRVAIHVSLLRRIPECYPWLPGSDPAVNVNHHIYVYDLRGPAPAAAL